MKTALFLSEYDLSTVHYLCTYYKDNANLDAQDVDYINELPIFKIKIGIVLIITAKIMNCGQIISG